MTASPELFAVEVEKEQLIFSAAHFITFGNNICESIHGHNYKVRCTVFGQLNEHGYVVDFIAIRDRLREITARFDHHVLLPTLHPTILVDSSATHEVIVRFEGRRWVFPRIDCVLLPISNTTAELLAKHICEELLPLIATNRSIQSIEMAVDENEGQWGIYRKLLDT